MKLMSLICGALLVLLAGCANAATLGFSIVINGPASTSIACPIQYPAGATAFTTPVAAGTVICPIMVSPSNWSGTLSLGGSGAGMLAISNGASGSAVVVGTTPITSAGTYNVTITATP